MIVIRNRAFGLLWSGQLLSNMGNWLMVIAVPVFVYTLTGSAVNTSLAFVAETLPAALFAPVAGVLVDRWNRRFVMIASDLVRAGVILALFLVDRPGLVWIVFATLFVENTVSLLFQPAHRGVLVAVVGRGDDLETAMSWYTASAGVVRLAGAPIGGALYALLSFRWLVGLDAATYVVSAILLTAMGRIKADPNPSPSSAPERPGMWAEMTAGWGFLRHHRVLGALLLVDTLFLLANGGVNVLVVPFAVSHLHVKSDGVGLLMSALGAGYLLSAKLGKMVSVRGELRRGAAAMLVLIALLFAAFFSITWFPAALISIGLVGVPGGALLMVIQVSLQRHTPDELMGRVGSTFSSVEMVGTVVGALAAGALAGRLGIGTVIAGAVAVLLVAAACAAIWLPGPAAQPGDEAAEDQPEVVAAG